MEIDVSKFINNAIIEPLDIYVTQYDARLGALVRGVLRAGNDLGFRVTIQSNVHISDTTAQGYSLESSFTYSGEINHLYGDISHVSYKATSSDSSDDSSWEDLDDP